MAASIRQVAAVTGAGLVKGVLTLVFGPSSSAVSTGRLSHEGAPREKRTDTVVGPGGHLLWASAPPGGCPLQKATRMRMGERVISPKLFFVPVLVSGAWWPWRLGLPSLFLSWSFRFPVLAPVLFFGVASFSVACFTQVPLQGGIPSPFGLESGRGRDYFCMVTFTGV